MPKLNKHLLLVNRTSFPYSDPNKIRLHASERDIPYSELIWNDFLSRLSPYDMMYYPNVDVAYDALSQFSGIPKGNLTLFDGSSNGIRNLFSLFATPNSKVVTTDPSFPMYAVYADINQATTEKIVYTNEEFPLRDLLSAIDETTSIVILSNPNSPVGNTLPRTDLIMIADRCNANNAVLVVDEAYIEFSNATTMEDVAMHNDHIVVLRTFSKAYGSAGGRIGYAIASDTNTHYLSLVRSMNEISGCSIRWMETLCDHRMELDDYISAVIRNREILQLHNISLGRSVICSQTNFTHISDYLLPDEFVYKTTTMPWTDMCYSRISIPANDETIRRMLEF